MWNCSTCTFNMVKLFLAFLLFLFHKSSCDIIEEKCLKKQDVMVVAELKPGSKSYAQNVVEFMKNLQTQLQPDGKCLKLGYIVVTNTPAKAVDLNCDTSSCFPDGQRLVSEIVESVPYDSAPYDRNAMVKAMKMAEKQLFKGGFNPDDPREKFLVMLLSSSQQASGPNIAEEAKELMDMKVKVVAMGVDGLTDASTLEDVASELTYAILLETESALKEIGVSRARGALNQPPVVRTPGAFSADLQKIETLKNDAKDFCQNVVDIAFIVDSSGSVKKYYEKEKFFVQRIASRFRIIEEGTHGGVVLFSSHGYIETRIKFADYLTTDTFNQAVELLPFYGYMTRIDKALELAHKELYTAEGMARPNVKKLLFLITDGKQNPDNIGGVRLNPADQAEKLHLGGVQIYAVAVGSKVNLTELQSITKDPRKVFSVTDFDELINDAFVKNVSRLLCQGAVQGTEKPVTITPKKSDCKDNCKCGGCGCCGKKPVYVNIFQGSNNYVSQGQEVTQTGSGNSAGAVGAQSKFPGAKEVSKMTDQQVTEYIKTLIPYYESMNKSLQELLKRALVNKNDGNIWSRK